MKTIIEQIKEKPKQHFALFTCWGFAVVCFVLGIDASPFLAAGFIISAIIDSET